MSEPICSKDCFNCPFPDCINDTFDAEDLAASEAVERDFIQSRTKEQRRKAAYYRSFSPEQKAEHLEYNRQWREKNRERYKAARRLHYAKNRERILAYQKARRDAGLDSRAGNQRRREYQKEYQRAYYQKNRERILAARRALREAGKRKENENAQSLSERCAEGTGGH